MSATEADPNAAEEINLTVAQENVKIPQLENDLEIGTNEIKDNSMEKLVVDEEEGDITLQDKEQKETSAEDDFLGKQSLIYSGSESDDGTDKKPLKSTKRILDSEDEEREISQPNLHKAKQITITDSDCEPENVLPSDEVAKARKILNKLDELSEDQSQKENNDDLENDRDVIKEIKTSRKLKISALIDSDTESDPESSPKIINNSPKTRNRWKDRVQENEAEKKYNLKSPYDFESDSDSQAVSNRNKVKPKKRKETKNSKVTSNGSESSSSSNSQMSTDEIENIAQNSNQEEATEKKSKPMRASAKKALDEMQAIQSEQQRLHREAHISIPYHKPKRHTLQEFLKRRTIIKPQDVGDVSNLSYVVRSKSLKMSAEELAEYAKLMEERANEATEFFKSESEDEELKDNNVTDEKLDDGKEFDGKQSQNDATIDENKKTTEKISDTAFQMETAMQNTEETNIKSPFTETNFDNEYSEHVEKTPSLIVTEVIELPKIDISSLHLTPTSLITPENIKRIIHEKNLPESPSLQGDKNMLIDLETGDLVAKRPSGVDNLLKRFLVAKANKKPKTTETLRILSTENGKLEISKVNIKNIDETEIVEQKPGAAYFKLKENLRSIITKKRREELEKKKAEKREEELEFNKCLEGDQDEEEEEAYEEFYDHDKTKKINNVNLIEIDEDENAVNAYEEDEALEANEDDFEYEEVDDENSACKTEILAKSSSHVNEDNNGKLDNNEELSDEEQSINDDENEQNDSEEEKSDSDSGDDDNNQENDIENNLKRKSRIIKGFQNDSDEELDLLKTPSTQTIMSLTSDKIFEEDNIKNPSEAENELLDLCSGKFSQTQKNPNHAFISQIPVTQAISTEDAAADELLELCSGTFEENKAENPNVQSVPTAVRNNKIISSDEENSINTENTTEIRNRMKKLTKRMKKGNAKLGFSDDEDEETTQLSAEESIDDEVEYEDVPQTFIDYDSEENEVVVEMTKKECVKRAENFFEKEAELSESEWGSADEDEKNLDKYDIELGDEDEFDKEKLRTELGQIHARKMLDEDIREVRKIQEMFFEDEEKDGVGRQRQFRWKNAESGFSLEDPNGEDKADGENHESGDEENEHLWRKIRYEREQLLKEQVLKETSQEIYETTITGSKLANNILDNTGISKKLNIITANKMTTLEVKKSSPFLISKSIAVTNRKAVRGSFLVRDKETLSKLAGLTKNGLSDANGTAGTVSTKDIKAQNFVFATLTEEEHTNLKRKSIDVLNSSSENGINYMKKPKTEARKGRCLIDQLL